MTLKKSVKSIVLASIPLWYRGIDVPEALQAEQ